MKLPAHDYLERRGIPHEKREFPPDIAKGAASVARALGFEEGQMVKTLLFETGEGEAVLVLVGGDRKVVSGKLKRATGSRNVKLASLDRVVDVTGYEVGSVPPFGWQPEGFRSLLDKALLEHEVLGVGAGKWGHEILIAAESLVAAVGAEVVDLTECDPK